MAERIEQLGPAERIVETLTRFSDHLVHNRPGVVTQDATRPAGVRWRPVFRRDDTVFDRGKRAIGTLRDHDVVQDGNVVARYREPGLFPEVARYLYRAIADVWRMDQSFVAHWASWAFGRRDRDVKVMLAAFMLVQDRFGAPIMDAGRVVFFDDDYRDVGEAMALLRDQNALSPKLLVRVGDVLELDDVASINRELGFGRSARRPAMGRYRRLVDKWLRYREHNPRMLDGLVRAGYGRTVRRLACRVGYRPDSARFFEVLRWRQSQARDGRRTMLNVDIGAAESWRDLSEQQICERIVRQRPDYKRLVGMLPDTGLTRAIAIAAAEARCFSDQDFVILTPTFEELGVLRVPAVERPWREALQRAENQRAANVARNLQSHDAKQQLQRAADDAAARTIEAATKGLRVYCLVDKSSSMEQALDTAKQYIERFLGAFPRLHCAVFNTIGTEVVLRDQSAAAVQHAFRGHHAGGGTSYAAGVLALAHHRPDDDEDVVMLFVGDEDDQNVKALAEAARLLRPAAFGVLRVVSPGWGAGSVVRDAAAQLGIPCFNVDDNMFATRDPYGVTRVIRDLMATTPVGAGRRSGRRTLVHEILDTELLRKPAWA